MNFYSRLRKFYFYGYIIYNVNRYRYIYEICCFMKCDVYKMIMIIYIDCDILFIVYFVIVLNKILKELWI